MKPFPLKVLRLAPAWGGLFLAFSALLSLKAESPLPQAVPGDAFAALVTNSPFGRSVDVSKAMVITGLAHVGDEVFATLLNVDTGESQVVSKTQNPSGWQLVELKGEQAGLELLTAQVRSSSGEVLRVRYEKNPPRPKTGVSVATSTGPPLSPEQNDAVKRAAERYQEGFPGDGYPNPPPPEIVEKLSKLSPDERANLARRVLEMRNKGVSSEDRRRTYGEMLDKAVKKNEKRR